MEDAVCLHAEDYGHGRKKTKENTLTTESSSHTVGKLQNSPPPSKKSFSMNVRPRNSIMTDNSDKKLSSFKSRYSTRRSSIGNAAMTRENERPQFFARKVSSASSSRGTTALYIDFMENCQRKSLFPFSRFRHG